MLNIFSYVSAEANKQLSVLHEEVGRKSEDNIRQQEEITQLLSQIVDLQRKLRDVRGFYYFKLFGIELRFILNWIFYYSIIYFSSECEVGIFWLFKYIYYRWLSLLVFNLNMPVKLLMLSLHCNEESLWRKYFFNLNIFKIRHSNKALRKYPNQKVWKYQVLNPNKVACSCSQFFNCTVHPLMRNTSFIVI